MLKENYFLKVTKCQSNAKKSLNNRTIYQKFSNLKLFRGQYSKTAKTTYVVDLPTATFFGVLCNKSEPKCTVVGILFCNWLILNYYKWVSITTIGHQPIFLDNSLMCSSSFWDLPPENSELLLLFCRFDLIFFENCHGKVAELANEKFS